MFTGERISGSFIRFENKHLAFFYGSMSTILTGADVYINLALILLPRTSSRTKALVEKVDEAILPTCEYLCVVLFTQIFSRRKRTSVRIKSLIMHWSILKYQSQLMTRHRSCSPRESKAWGNFFFLTLMSVNIQRQRTCQGRDSTKFGVRSVE